MIKDNMEELYGNTKTWQDSSDGWVKTMTESKENKEQYQEYVADCLASAHLVPISYRDWLKKKQNNDNE
tara:strand:- start:10588 stop:10794 length:207 start_codon:yes stop_codon:yes gene_type:complete